MTVDEITTIADEILKRYYAGAGYELVEVRPDYNQTDEPSLFVVAHFKPSAVVTGGAEANAAHAALWMALREKGEERFPYLDFRYPDDEILGDDEEDYRDAEKEA